jgi:hypothetical protein
MSARSVPPRVLQSRVMVGGSARGGSEDFESARADALFFRGQALAIVRHFFEIASQVGRLPSILGRELFRAKVSHHAIPSFEEQAVFVHDVEHALGQLTDRDAEVMALVGLFHYSLDDAAAMLGRSRTGITARFSDALDRLAEIFLETGLLREDQLDRRPQRFEGAACAGCRARVSPKKPAVSVPGATNYNVTASPARQVQAAGRTGA